jgi:hypothetical protein
VSCARPYLFCAGLGPAPPVVGPPFGALESARIAADPVERAQRTIATAASGDATRKENDSSR